MVSPIAASVNAEADALATVRLNSCFVNFRPPLKNEKPRTNNRLPMIEPVIEALTTPSKPLASANRAMISSAALPKVALLGGSSHPGRQWDDRETRDDEQRSWTVESGHKAHNYRDGHEH